MFGLIDICGTKLMVRIMSSARTRDARKDAIRLRQQKQLAFCGLLQTYLSRVSAQENDWQLEARFKRRSA